MGQSYDFRPWQTSLLIGAVTALTSQIYLFIFINNFRISPAVILLPVLLIYSFSQN